MFLASEDRWVRLNINRRESWINMVINVPFHTQSSATQVFHSNCRDLDWVVNLCILNSELCLIGNCSTYPYIMIE